MPSIMHMLTSSGAGTSAGWEAGVERLMPAENLGGATARGSKPAAEGFGTGSLLLCYGIPTLLRDSANWASGKGRGHAGRRKRARASIQSVFHPSL